MKADTFLRDKYSFAPIDIAHYISGFLEIRRKKVRECHNIDLREQLLIFNNLEVITRAISNEYFTGVSEIFDTKEGYATFPLLKKCYVYLTKKEHQTLAVNNILDKYQKKFEVFGRIFNVYNKEFKKNSDFFKDLKVYALLSINLSIRFMQNNNYNDLNTVVKLNDLILFSEWEIKPEYNNLIFYSILCEQNIINSIYGR
ncbi:MAG: hypothetical protein NTX44_11010 [Ignavibacteriales bacterium]|nr:hypothetical protein [Ignavibacteriales bacterium]